MYFTKNFGKILPDFLLFRLPGKNLMYSARNSENLDPIPHFQTSWQNFYVFCKII